MDNQEIRDEIRKRSMDIPVPDSLHPDQIEKKLENTKQRRPSAAKRLRFGVAAAASIAVICAAGVGLRPILWEENHDGSSTDSTVEQTTIAGEKDHADTTYEEIYDAIHSFQKKNQRQKEASLDIASEVIPETSVNDAESDTMMEHSSETKKSILMDSADSASSSRKGDYSETDTQVAGIMEGDIVKTDGTHIFTIKDSTAGCTVTIYEARGNRVDEQSHFTISQADCREMYIQGSTLILTGNLWDTDGPVRSGTDEPELLEPYDSASKSHITLYDFSDPAAPKAIRQLSQSGAYNTSRISDGYLYTFTNYNIQAAEDYSKDEREKFIPELNGVIMKSEDIRLPDRNGADSYMVMTSLKLSDNGKFTDSKAVLGSFDTHYMNQDHIYAVSRNYQDNGDVRSTILKYTYDKGRFFFHSSAAIRGAIRNSYYMHEYRDSFVFVYTRTSGRDTNGLCVMDQDLKLTGEISDLGVNETIYASYFIENMAYFVTYRNTDPVFAVDISDPKKPVLKSELKLPGFSSYLHSFGDDMLIGIGQGSKSSGGSVSSEDRVKLSLFSIDSDYRLREIDKLLAAPDTESCADTNHKSVFVDEELGLIGLGVVDYRNSESAYHVYRCKKGKLKKVLSVSLSKSFDIYNVRGLRIGKYFYVVDTLGGIEVYHIDTWKKVK